MDDPCKGCAHIDGVLCDTACQWWGMRVQYEEAKRMSLGMFLVGYLAGCVFVTAIMAAVMWGMTP